MKGSEEGFTLIEVLVSFTILSVLLIMSFGAFSDGLRRLGHAEETRSRIDQAAQLMSQIEVGGGLADVPGFRVVRQQLGGADPQYRRASVLVRIFDGDQPEPLLETIVVERLP